MAELAGTFLGEEVYWIPGFKGSYGVTKTGKVFSAKNTCWLSARIDKSGYSSVSLYNQTRIQAHGYLIHRLVAATFLNLDLSKSEIQVDHINKIRSDNTVSNLRLCTCKQNLLWIYGTGQSDTITHKECRRCLQIKPRNEFVKNTRNTHNCDAHGSYCKSCINEARQLKKEKQQCL